jgi:hypothetical protein
MTTGEIVKEYKKRFILIIETKGEELNNKFYKNIENILDGEFCKTIEEDSIVKDAPLEIFIATYLVSLLMEMYGLDKFDGEYITERDEYKFIYDHYLKSMTDKFTSQYGLPSVNMERIGFRIFSIGKK